MGEARMCALRPVALLRCDSAAIVDEELAAVGAGLVPTWFVRHPPGAPLHWGVLDKPTAIVLKHVIFRENLDRCPIQPIREIAPRLS